MNSSEAITHLSENGEALFLRGEISGETGAMHRPAEQQIHWYAVRTLPRHEKSIREHLGHRDVNCFLPVYRSVRRWRNGCDAQVELPLFPGYLFVRIDLGNRVQVLEVPGVISLVGAGRQPLPLPDSEIMSLRDGLQLHKCEPHAYLAVGQRVRIKAGPLVDWTGIVVRKNGSLRVVLALDQIMQGVAVTLDERDIEIAAPSMPGSNGDPSKSRIRLRQDAFEPVPLTCR